MTVGSWRRGSEIVDLREVMGSESGELAGGGGVVKAGKFWEGAQKP